MRSALGFDRMISWCVSSIGDELNISRSGSPVEAQALRKLRSAARKKRLSRLPSVLTETRGHSSHSRSMPHSRRLRFQSRFPSAAASSAFRLRALPLNRARSSMPRRDAGRVFGDEDSNRVIVAIDFELSCIWGASHSALAVD